MKRSDYYADTAEKLIRVSIEEASNFDEPGWRDRFNARAAVYSTLALAAATREAAEIRQLPSLAQINASQTLAEKARRDVLPQVPGGVLLHEPPPTPLCTSTYIVRTPGDWRTLTCELEAGHSRNHRNGGEDWYDEGVQS